MAIWNIPKLFNVATRNLNKLDANKLPFGDTIGKPINGVIGKLGVSKNETAMTLGKKRVRNKSALRRNERQMNNEIKDLKDKGATNVEIATVKKRYDEQRANLKKDTPDYWDIGKAYFGENGKMATRVGTAAGIYGVSNIGNRYLSGGSLTTNNRGERDIAGIPFI